MLLPSKSTFGSQIDSIDFGVRSMHNFSTPGFGRKDSPFLIHSVDAEVYTPSAILNLSMKQSCTLAGLTTNSADFACIP